MFIKQDYNNQTNVTGTEQTSLKTSMTIRKERSFGFIVKAKMKKTVYCYQLNSFVFILALYLKKTFLPNTFVYIKLSNRRGN